MNRQWTVTIAVFGLATTMAMTARAQGTRARVTAPEPTTVAGQAASTGTRTVVGMVETRITPDRPYSAEAVNESLQMLPDGNKIHRTSVTRVYRDSAGRTRREMLAEDGTVRSISIWDPVGNTNYTLDPETKVATRGGGVIAPMRSPAATAAPTVAQGTAVGGGSGVRTAAPSGVSIARSGGSGGGVMTAVGGGNREPLDPQTIEGLSATGTRTTTTIPPGKVGNAQELKIVSEQWFSDELQVLVMTRHSDPRSGETVYRLRNVLRAEPDPSLFMLPPDYTLQERR